MPDGPMADWTPAAASTPSADPRQHTTRRQALWTMWRWAWGVALVVGLAAANLLAGLAGGLSRLGWPTPTPAIAVHGGVLLFGFFGALIALERAVALRSIAAGWGLMVPGAAALGGVLVWASAWPAAGWALNLLASTGLAGLYGLAAHRRADSLHLRVQAGAAVCWTLGTVAMLGQAPAAATLAGMAFLVGTIAGERRELTQFVRLRPAAARGFLLIVACGAASVLAGVVGAVAPAAAAPLVEWAPWLWWLSVAGLALWLIRLDVGLHGWLRAGWVGHTALCLAVGYGWMCVAALLALSGLLAQAFGPANATVAAWAPSATHALLLGFVFAMVFGHAPLMLPALARVRPVYTGWVRWPLWLLGFSLALRVVATGLGDGALLAWAGAGHALALALFALTMAWATWQGMRRSAI